MTMDLFSYSEGRDRPERPASPPPAPIARKKPGARPPAPEPQVLSVTDLTRAVRSALESAIGQVWVEGEISNLRKQSSGHQYFTLKDDRSQVSCVLFARAGLWRRAPELSDGMCVQVRGALTVYEARGQYQINVQLVQAAGAGLLQAKFEALKRKLEAEGLFAAERKRPLPRMPRRIAIVTSPTGAVIRDMLNILGRRAPWVHVLVHPVRVQGTGAAREIARAIQVWNAAPGNGLPRVDALVLARGGGSAEDLWEFNEENLARAIAASTIPVVSAVGHEVDFTISDFVADLRAPTPSAAAELIAPDAAELRRHVQRCRGQLARLARAAIESRRRQLTALGRSGLFREPRRRLEAWAQRLDYAAELLRRRADEVIRRRRERLREMLATLRYYRPDHQLVLRRQKLQARWDDLIRLGEARLRERRRAIEEMADDLARLGETRLRERRRTLEKMLEKLRLLSPDSTLQRGYTITFSAEGQLIRTAGEVAPGDGLVTRFADGEVASIVSPKAESAREKSGA